MHSTPAGGNLPPRRGAEGPDLVFGSPPACQTRLAVVRRGQADRASDAVAAPKRSDHTENRDNAGSAPSAPPPRHRRDRRNDSSIHACAPCPDNRWGTLAAFL